jgi:hypothetical protein
VKSLIFVGYIVHHPHLQLEMLDPNGSFQVSQHLQQPRRMWPKRLPDPARGRAQVGTFCNDLGKL